MEQREKGINIFIALMAYALNYQIMRIAENVTANKANCTCETLQL